MNSFGATIGRTEQAIFISTSGGLQVERIGDLVVMGEGLDYFVAAAERVTYAGGDHVGISAYRVIETEEG